MGAIYILGEKNIFIYSTRKNNISIKDAVKVFLLTSTRLMV